MIKRIKTQEEVKSKQKRNQVIIGILLVALMVFSTAGYSLMNNDTGGGSSNKVKENGFEFLKNGDSWVVAVSGKQFVFRYLPSEVENVSINGTLDFNQYNGKAVYFVNPNFASQEIVGNIGGYFLKYQEACLNESCGDLPIKTCNDNLIVFKEENETRVYKENNCVYLSGDYLKATDAFLYKILGIS